MQNTPEQMINKKNDHPYIVAIGNNKKNIVHYMIEFERHLISVSNCTDLLNTKY